MNLKTDLMKHQIAAYEKIKNIKVGALFMDMGTGKTRTAIELIKYRKEAGKLNKVFWVCPVSTKENLRLEIYKHSNYTAERIEKYLDEDICIVGIESISQSDVIYMKFRSLIEKETDSMMIIDESHTIKNHTSKRTQRMIDSSSFVKYRLIMTGTPVTQGVWDLFTQFYFLYPKILGYKSFNSFAKNHLEYSEKFPGMIERAHNIEYLTAKINPYIYQVTKKECLDLPEKSYTSRDVEAPFDIREDYEILKNFMLEQIDFDNFNSMIIFRMLGYLHRIASGNFERKIKNKVGKTLNFKVNSDYRVKLLKETVDEIDLVENKLVIWYRYNTDLKLIESKLKQEFVVFNGLLKEKEKIENLKKFRFGKINILVANIASGSTGLNLQEANYMIYYNNTFDYAKRVQSEDRIHRIGQTKNCHIVDVESWFGIDEKISKAIKNKKSLAKELREKINEVKDNREKIEDFKLLIKNEF